MRLAIFGLIASHVLFVSLADAGRRGSSGGGRLGKVNSGISRSSGSRGGGGRLGKVNSGISRATRHSRSNSSSSSSSSSDTSPPHRHWHRRSSRVEYVAPSLYHPRVDYPTGYVSETRYPANFDGFVGMHKVVESNRALSLALSFDYAWCRIAGTLTRYQEKQFDGSEVTLTLPALTIGVRVDGGARQTRVVAEVGVVGVSTVGPTDDSSLRGQKLGIHAEHRFGGSGNPALVADAHYLYFGESGVKAFSGRAGVRVSYLELAFRVLDFNVGPALYGPEVGLQF